MISRGLVWGVLTLAVAVSLPVFRHGPRLSAAPEARPLSKTLNFAGTRRALIICGHPGDKAHRKPFAETVEKLREALIERYGFAAADVHVQFGGPLAERSEERRVG